MPATTKGRKTRSAAAGAKPDARSILRERFESEYLERLGAALAARRSELGLTQRDVANQIGASMSQIWKIESGQVDPWYDSTSEIRWVALLNALGWTEDDLAMALGHPEGADVFYGIRRPEHALSLPPVKRLETATGPIFLGLPELADVPENKLFVYEPPTGVRIVMQEVTSDKDLKPGDLVLVDHGDGNKEVYRFSGWSRGRPVKPIFIRQGEHYEMPVDAVVGKAVLILGPPDMRI